jgi:hypothetical protein
MIPLDAVRNVRNPFSLSALTPLLLSKLFLGEQLQISEPGASLGRSHRARNSLPLRVLCRAELLGRERDYGAGIIPCLGGLEYTLSWLFELTAVVR